MQNAMIGNTAFLTGIEYTAGPAATDLRIGIRNNVTLPAGDAVAFWAGRTRVFLELLPLSPVNGTFEAMEVEDLEYAHKVWDTPRHLVDEGSDPGAHDVFLQTPLYRGICSATTASACVSNDATSSSV